MAEEIKNVNAKIDELEATAKKYASKDTVISIGGYEFTPAKLMVAFTLVSSTLGGLYGAFEVYKDYQGMKKRIAEYVAPDLSVFDKRLAVIEENSQKATDYTRDIKNDLKGDVRRIEGVAEQIERSVKSTQRETETEMKSVRTDVRASLDKTRDDIERVRSDMDKVKRDLEIKLDKTNKDIEIKLDKTNKDMDTKLQKALDNPLSK
jgi:hypothetical protein